MLIVKQDVADIKIKLQIQNRNTEVEMINVEQQIKGVAFA